MTADPEDDMGRDGEPDPAETVEDTSCSCGREDCPDWMAGRELGWPGAERGERG